MIDDYRSCSGREKPPEPYLIYGSGQGDAPDLPADPVMQDLEYFQGMYPQRMKKLKRYVVEECDKADYKMSPIYDEFPDQVMVNQLCDNICRSIVKDESMRAELEPLLTGFGAGADEDVTDVEEVETYEAARAQQLMGPGPVRPPWGPPPPPRPPQPPWGPPPPPRPPQPPWGPPPPPRPPQPPWGPPPPPRPPQPPWGPPPPPRPPQPPWGPPPPPRPPQPPWGPPPPPRPPQPPWGPPPPPRPPQGSGWLNDVVRVLLLNELHNRRCRIGRC